MASSKPSHELLGKLLFLEKERLMKDLDQAQAKMTADFNTETVSHLTQVAAELETFRKSMDNPLTNQGLALRLLLREKDRLMTDLSRAQYKMFAEFSLETSSRLTRIATELGTVCEAVQSFKHSCEEDRICTTTLEAVEAPPDRLNSGVDALERASDEATSAQKTLRDDKPNTPTARMKPPVAAAAQCTRCQKPTAQRPFGDQLCSNCRIEADSANVSLPDTIIVGSRNASMNELPLRQLAQERNPTGEPVKTLVSPAPDDSVIDVPQTKLSATGPVEFDQLDRGRYPHIIYFDDAWMEIQCPDCSANVCPDKNSRTYGMFWNGIKSLTSHMILKHNSNLSFDKHGWAKVAKSGAHRYLSTEDVLRIAAGKKPKAEIKKYVARDKTFEEAFEESLGVSQQTPAPSLKPAKKPVSTGPAKRKDSRANLSFTKKSGNSLVSRFHAPTPATSASPPSSIGPTSERGRSSISNSTNRRTSSALFVSDRSSSIASMKDNKTDQYNEWKDIVASAKNGVQLGKRRASAYRNDESDEEDWAGGAKPPLRRLKRQFYGSPADTVQGE